MGKVFLNLSIQRESAMLFSAIPNFSMLSDFYILQTSARPNTSLEQFHIKVHRARDFSCVWRFFLA